MKKSSKKKLRVALVVPNFQWCDWDENTLWHFIPYGLCLLAAIVKDLCEISIIDANAMNMNDLQFTEALSKFNPDVVGITVHMDQYAQTGHYAAKVVKKFNSKTKVIMGGVYTTMNPDLTMKDPNVDYAVIREGEVVFRELLNYFLGNNPLPKKGIGYRIDGKIINCGHADFIQDLDALPLPAYHLIDFGKYANTILRKSVDNPQEFPYARIFTSRGCPCGCIFCQAESISGKKFRARSAENTLQEIQWLKDSYGIKSLTFDDDNMLLDRRRATAIFKGMIDRNLAMPWYAGALAEFTLNEQLIELMYSSGCKYINIAIESGSERILKQVIKKPVNVDHAKMMIAKAKKVGIYVVANFIVGFPTESWDEIRQTIKLAEDVNADYVKIFSATPLPHTKLWQLCEQEKCFKKGFKQSEICWDTGQTETKDFTCKDLTILRAYEWDRINFTDSKKRNRTAKMMGISEEELLEIRRRTLNRITSTAA